MKDLHRKVDIEGFIELGRKEMEKFDNVNIYFTLKSMNIRNMNEHTVKNVKICLALDSLGLKITSQLFTYLKYYFKGISLEELAKHRANIIGSLHTYGDKNLLTMLRQSYRKNHETKWIINPVFKEKLNGGKNGKEKKEEKTD